MAFPLQTPTAVPDALLSPEEVMAWLGYRNRDAFMRMVRKAGIPRVRINARVVRFYRSQIEAYIRRKRVGPFFAA
jgi:predicted DNA-binding transcriptional regulator AlpA